MKKYRYIDWKHVKKQNIEKYIDWKHIKKHNINKIQIYRLDTY